MNDTFPQYFSIEANDFFFQGSGIVTLCGSTKFFFHYMEANRVLTFLDWVVLQCGSYGHSFHKFAKEEVRDFNLVKRLHFEKILMADCIVVCTDETRYLGDSTKAEIAYAKHIGIPVFYFDGTLQGIDKILKVPTRYKNKGIEKFLTEYESNPGFDFT